MELFPVACVTKCYDVVGEILDGFGHGRIVPKKVQFKGIKWYESIVLSYELSLKLEYTEAYDGQDK